MQPLGADAGDFEQMLGQLDLFFGLDITFQVMAVAEMSPGHQDPVGAGFQRRDDKGRIHPARAHDPDRAQVGRILHPGYPGEVRAGIGTPVAKKRHNLWLEFYHGFTFALSVGS
jgi:hypothetical protein